MTSGTGGLGLTGGGTPHDSSGSVLFHGGRMFDGLVAVAWALVDHPVVRGGFCCVPGSHRANFTLPSTRDPDFEAPVPMAAGDVLVFTEALTHGTLPWRGEPRRRERCSTSTPRDTSPGAPTTSRPRS